MATKRRWMYAQPKPAKPKVPEYLKSVVKTKADEFVESFLKPTFIKDPPRIETYEDAARALRQWAAALDPRIEEIPMDPAQTGLPREGERTHEEV
jgi:hypothetical protein